MTVTSNLHIGLAAWQSSHAYNVLGARVSNGGNAYQLTGTGTSGSTGPTGIGSSIADNTATWKWLSAVNFTTLAAWAASIPATLTQPIIGLLWNDSVITTTLGVSFLTLSGHSTSATNTITLKCATGESFRDKLAGQSTALAFNTANGVSFQLPTGTGGVNYILISDSNVIVDGLQFQDPSATSNSTIFASNGSNVTLSNCILDGFAQTGGACILDATSSPNLRIENSLIVDRQTGNGFFASLQMTGAIINSTIINLTGNTNGSTVDFGGTTGCFVKNCAIFGYDNPVTTGPAAVDHCCLSATTVGSGGTDAGGNFFSKTASNQFLNASTDFRLKLGSDCIDTAVTDLVDIVSGDDIAESHRPFGAAWDIGCWEYLGTGVTPILLAPDPPSLNLVFILDPDNPGTVSGVSSTPANTSINLSWTAPPTPTLIQLLVDLPTGSNNVAGAAVSVFPLNASGSALQSIMAAGNAGIAFPGGVTQISGTVSGTSVTLVWDPSSGTISAFGTMLQANGLNATVSLAGISASGTMNFKASFAGSSSFLAFTCSASMTSKTFVNATASVLLLAATGSISQTNFVATSSPPPTFAQVSGQGVSVVTNLASEFATFFGLSGGGTASTKLGATASNSVLVIQGSGFLSFPVTEFFGLSTFFRISNTASASLVLNCSAAVSIEVISDVITATQSDIASASVSVLTIQTVAQGVVLNATSATNSFNLSCAGIATSASAFLRASFFQLITGAVATLTDRAAGTISLPVIGLPGPFYPSLLEDGSGLALKADGAPPLLLLADVPYFNLLQNLIGLAAANIDITAVCAAFQSDGASFVSTVATLSSITNAILEVQASTVKNIDLIAVGFIDQLPTMGIANIDITSVISIQQFDLASAVISIVLTPVATITQRNLVNGEAALEIVTTVAQVGQFDQASLAQNIDITTASTAMSSDVATAVKTLFTISAVVTAVQSDTATTTARLLSLTATSALGQSNPIQAAATLSLSVIGSVIQRDLATTSASINFTGSAVAYTTDVAHGDGSSINITATAAAVQQDQAAGSGTLFFSAAVVAGQSKSVSGSASINLTAVGQTAEFVNASGVASIDITSFSTAFDEHTFHGTNSIPLVCVAALKLFGSKMQTVATIEAINLIGTAALTIPAIGIARYTITCGPNAHLWITPPGYVAGDNVVYWEE